MPHSRRGGKVLSVVTLCATDVFRMSRLELPVVREGARTARGIAHTKVVRSGGCTDRLFGRKEGRLPEGLTALSGWVRLMAPETTSGMPR